MQNMIETQNLNFFYKKEEDEQDVKIVLDNINLEIKHGEFVAVLGHNGSGKSTLAKHFNVILLPCGGKVLINDMDTHEEALIFKIRQSVGMVFQNPDNQIVATVVEEDVAFAPENLGIAPKEIVIRVEEALKSVGMYEYKDMPPHKLSGGQKQRVAIAGVIAMKPDCIVFDEPTAMLDPIGRREVMTAIKKLNKEFGLTIVLITHYMDEAAEANRVIVLDEGTLFLDDTPKNVFSQVELLKEKGLDVPYSVELLYALKSENLVDEYNILGFDECVEKIYKLLE